MAKLAPQGKFRAFDENGNPLSGGKLYTYEAGTSTPKATYTDASESTPNANPVTLDANGYADVWLASGAYKFVLDDSTGVNQWTLDNVSTSDSNTLGSSVVSQSTNLNLTSVLQGSHIVATQSLTISLLPASVAGEGFLFSVQNTSTGDVTIDPDGSELVDGDTTFVIPAGGGGTIVCDGSEWQLIGMVTVRNDADNVFTGNNSGVGIVPVGSVIDFYGTTVPDPSFAFPYGQELSRTAYPELFALFGTTYGVGDGSTTFNIPDLRGRDGIGLDNMGGVAASRINSLTSLGLTGGAEGDTVTDGHALTDAEMSHKHETTVNNAASIGTDIFGRGTTVFTGSSEGGAGSAGATGGHLTNTPESVTSTEHTHNLTQDNILNPYIGCNKIMRIK